MGINIPHVERVMLWTTPPNLTTAIQCAARGTGGARHWRRAAAARGTGSEPAARGTGSELAARGTGSELAARGTGSEPAARGTGASVDTKC